MCASGRMRCKGTQGKTRKSRTDRRALVNSWRFGSGGFGMNGPCCLAGAAWCGRGRARWGKHPAARIKKKVAHAYVAALSVGSSALQGDNARMTVST